LNLDDGLFEKHTVGESYDEDVVFDPFVSFESDDTRYVLYSEFHDMENGFVASCELYLYDFALEEVRLITELGDGETLNAGNGGGYGEMFDISLIDGVVRYGVFDEELVRENSYRDDTVAEALIEYRTV